MQPLHAQEANSNLITNILNSNSATFKPILTNLENNRLQLLFTQIKSDKKGNPQFTHHHFNTEKAGYFYPASTVKLPIALLALQRLKELNIDGLNRNTTFITLQNGDGQTAVHNDPSALDGRPTIAHYIKKILLVSDNDAYNRLYEFLGQDYIHTALKKMGYSDVRIVHRLELSLTESQNKHTNPIRFLDADGNIIYQQPARYSQFSPTPTPITLGKGYYKNGILIQAPFDFSAKNRLPLTDLHQMLMSIICPLSVDKKKRFNITEDDYAFIQKYMSMTPLESASPLYQEPAYWDNYVKFLYYGAEKVTPDSSVRIYNKVGDAYGFLIDAAYIVDYKNNVAFFLSAALLCNSDEIFNDDNYDYDTVGFPFLKALGKAIYQYELTQVSDNKKTLTPIVSNYKN
ncbi:MAG: hypothetical protein RIR12_2638 [Bacteroidota bacterium]|jgi:hypothetical protein